MSRDLAEHVEKIAKRRQEARERWARIDHKLAALHAGLKRWDEDWLRYKAQVELDRLRLTRPQEPIEPQEEHHNGTLTNPDAVARLLAGDTPTPDPDPYTLASAKRSVGRN